jgi:Tol biopolymer transport system component
VPLVEGVRTESSTVQYSVSASGTLAYVPGSVSDAARTDLALIDRKGAVTALKLPAGSHATPRLSPDGSRVAFGSGAGNEQAISIYDLAGTSAPRRLTFGGRNQFPVWSSDGQRVAFQSDREGDAAIFWQRADGAGPAERLTKAESGTAHVPESWSPDGKTLLFSIGTGSEVSLWTWSMADKKALPFGDVHGKYRTNASFSPDGRWVAYTTEGIFVQPFPATGAKYQIAKGTSGAAPHYPAWSRDGSELFYIPGRQRLEVVKVTTRPALAVAPPEELQRGPLFEDGPTTVRTFDISRDGRLLAIVPSGQAGSIGSEAARIEVVLNWFTELQQRVPGAR